MPKSTTSVTVTLPQEIQPVLDSLTGTTLDQKIVHLLLGETRRKLAACEQERLELEIKYGVEYPEFRRQLESGILGNEFSHRLEMDAMQWDDLIVEKQHWLRELRLLKELLQ